MNFEDVRELPHAQPLRALVLHSSNGRALPVPHPDYDFVTLGGRTLTVNSTTSESYAIIDVIDIPRIEVSVAESSAAASESIQPL